MNTNKRKNVLATFVALFAAGATVQANAQNEYGESARAQNVLDEIIVTAEKREQNLQDVPVAISAFSADMMEVRGILTPQDLQHSVPSLEISDDYRGPARITLRGVGSENPNPGGDPGVPVHINGHYMQSTAYVLRDMLDVERVEVLRGPQGTLYGRNAIGGSVNIVTKRPTEVFEGSVSADVGNYKKRLLQAVVSGPLSDNLRGRLAISDDKRDGYVENVSISGDDRDTSDYTSIRGALEYDLTDDIQLYLNAYYFDDVGNPGQRAAPHAQFSARFEAFPNYSNPSLSDPFKIANNTPSEQTNESKGGSLDINWDLGSVEFRSLSAYDHTDFTVFTDVDGSVVSNSELNFQTPIETFTQEFQLLSSDETGLNWVLGLFYYNESSFYDVLQITDGFGDRNGDGVIDENDPRRLLSLNLDVESTSLGVYGQVDYALTDQFELVAGLRYSVDEKKSDQSSLFIGNEGTTPLSAITPPFFQQKEWEEVTGKLGLNYHVNDEVMLYASYSRGYKAGGFNLFQVAIYDPERVDAFESGLKSRWLDNRLQVNVAAFYYDYQNKQDFQRVFDPVSGLTPPFILNASTATNSGVELEVQAQITEGFFVDASLGYLSAEFDDYTSDIVDLAQPTGRGIQDLSGNKLPFSPEWSAHLGAQYNWELAALGALSARVDYSWTHEQFANALNRTGESSPELGGDADFVPSSYLINARLQWTSIESNWQADLYIKNLTDEVIQSNTFVDFFGTWTSYLAPRTYGLKLSYSF